MLVDKMPLPVSQFLQFRFASADNIHYQIEPEELIKQTLALKQGTLSDTGALVVDTGKFTGRSPKDRFFVKDPITEKTIDWNKFNKAIDEAYFFKLKDKLLAYLSAKTTWARDCYACADDRYKLNIRVLTEKPWSSLFVYNMFLRPAANELEGFIPEWHVLQADEFLANPAEDGTRQQNFTIISFTHKTILIGGSGYTGEIKKGVFSILNFLLPHNADVLSMHCSANLGNNGDTAIFFGLSGTGKTTLSADPARNLIGDDEHGWSDNAVFNFEGGCYAKTIDLTEENEPEIYRAIKTGALVENTRFFNGTNKIDYSNNDVTENTRVSYPLGFIPNSVEPSIGPSPKNIFLLTCDAAGVLPPVSKLTPGQAMYQFISGYTAKIAGTEEGVTEPKSTFSACFGAPFMPLHPGFYAEMLGRKMKEQKVDVWLINTGWSGGPYGVGKRIKLTYTRAMITAALNGELAGADYKTHPVFGVHYPVSCTGVPVEILDPKVTWADKNAYDEEAKSLAELFIKNFAQYKDGVSEEVLAGAPILY